MRGTATPASLIVQQQQNHQGHRHAAAAVSQPGLHALQRSGMVPAPAWVPIAPGHGHTMWPGPSAVGPTPAGAGCVGGSTQAHLSPQAQEANWPVALAANMQLQLHPECERMLALVSKVRTEVNARHSSGLQSLPCDRVPFVGWAWPLLSRCSGSGSSRSSSCGTRLQLPTMRWVWFRAGATRSVCVAGQVRIQAWPRSAHV